MAKYPKEVCECVDWLITKVVKKNKRRKRVTFAESTKRQDGIAKERDRILLKWYKTNVKQRWRRSFNYYALSPSQIRNLKEDTKKIIIRLYSHPHRRITLLSNASGGTMPMITESYLVFYMISEIDYLHTAFR